MGLEPATSFMTISHPAILLKVRKRGYQPECHRAFPIPAQGCHNASGPGKVFGGEDKRSQEADRQAESGVGGKADGSASRLDNPSGINMEDPWAEGWEEGIDRVTDVKTFRIDRIKALGNGVVPQQVRFAFEYLLGLRPEQEPEVPDWEYADLEW